MDILFVVMPFADVERPALGVSLLTAAARRRGYTCAVRYFGFDLAAHRHVALFLDRPAG